MSKFSPQFPTSTTRRNVETRPSLLRVSTLASLMASTLASTTGCGVQFVDTEDHVPAAVAQAFEESCATAGCHSGSAPAQGLVLQKSSIVAAINGKSEQSDLPLITLGNIERSYLALKMLAPDDLPSGAKIIGTPMPPSTDAKSKANVAIILEWIRTPKTNDGTDVDSMDASDSANSEESTDSTSADDSNPDCLTPPELAEGEAPAARRDIAPIFEMRCSGTGCHANGGTTLPRLDEAYLHDQVVNVKVASGAKGVYVAPGDLQASYLWRKLTNTHEDVPGQSGMQMPLNKPLCQDELGVVKAWIEGGALP